MIKFKLFRWYIMIYKKDVSADKFTFRCHCGHSLSRHHFMYELLFGTYFEIVTNCYICDCSSFRE